jgi:glucose-1-phosphate thymidylyltransferase
VLTDEQDAVQQIDVKQSPPRSNWVWGAFKMPGAVFADLHRLWSLERSASDVYIGTLVNAYLAAGGRARAVRSGRAYFDVGTLDGYRQAIRLLSARPELPTKVTPEAVK